MHLFIIFTISLLFFTGCTTMTTQHDDSILVEAEHFADKGGWTLDAQFIDIMGSPYLLAHGLGKPVENAKTEVAVAEGGNYYVWVRTKNWVPGNWEAPGCFKLIVNGEEQSTVFGTETGWNWQKGSVVSLKKGKAVLELKDLTGFEGRCDAILLTQDANYKPDNNSEPMNEWRRQLLGIEMVPAQKTYDLVVVGGGFAGMGSAIAAARMGLKVALIQNRPVLGGNGSSEIRVAPRGNYPNWLYPLGEIIQEFSPWVHENVLLKKKYDDDLKLKVIKAEKNIDLFLNHHAYKVERDGKRIGAVYAISVKEKKVRQFKGAMFADCTGHGLVGKWAGADFHMEKKARMGMSNLWRWNYKKSVSKFPEVPWALVLDEKGFPYPNRRGNWFWESGFDKHPIDDLEDIRDHNFRAVYGAFNAMKNKGAYANWDKSKGKHGKAELDWVAYVGGTRETIQSLGDLVLSKEDIVVGRTFEDACVIVTWGLDLHYAHPLYAKQTPGNPFISRAHFGGKVDDSKGKLSSSPTMYVTSKDGHGFDRKKGYAIPYRCLYSRNLENLFVPGRNMSVTHEALGTVRVMQTLGMCGAAIGRAAYLCKKHDTTPRGVYKKHLEEIKKIWALPGKYRLL